MTLFLLVLLAALAFEYINGFHDAANAIATVVSTRVLTPRQAVEAGADYLVIGRPITAQPDPRAAAEAIVREMESPL